MNKQTFYYIEVRSNITEYVGQWDELHKLPDYALHFDETEVSDVLNRIADKYPKCKVVAVPVKEEQTDEKPINKIDIPMEYTKSLKIAIQSFINASSNYNHLNEEFGRIIFDLQTWQQLLEYKLSINITDSEIQNFGANGINGIDFPIFHNEQN